MAIPTNESGLVSDEQAEKIDRAMASCGGNREMAAKVSGLTLAAIKMAISRSPRLKIKWGRNGLNSTLRSLRKGPSGPGRLGDGPMPGSGLDLEIIDPDDMDDDMVPQGAPAETEEEQELGPPPTEMMPTDTQTFNRLGWEGIGFSAEEAIEMRGLEHFVQGKISNSLEFSHAHMLYSQGKCFQHQKRILEALENIKSSEEPDSMENFAKTQILHKQLMEVSDMARKFNGEVVKAMKTRAEVQVMASKMQSKEDTGKKRKPGWKRAVPAGKITKRGGEE